MSMRTIRTFRSCLVFFGLLAASAARAQTSPPANAEPVPEPAAAQEPAKEAPADEVKGPSKNEAAVSVSPAREAYGGAAPPAAPEESWFKRQPYEFTTNGWKLTVYGNLEFNVFHDNTRSYQEGPGNGLVAREGTYNNGVGRLIITSRNSRIGFKMEAPTADGIKTTALFEGDFDGNQPANPQMGITESSYYTAGTFRIRYANVKLESDVVDVLAGQALNLFGGSPFFFPCTAFNLGLPNEVFSRTPQLRIMKTIKGGAINVDVGIAALRPPQRDSEIPDGQGALRISLNNWKGLHTPAYAFTTVDPAAIGVSGAVRRFKVDQFAAVPTLQNKASGWGLSVDAFLPVIPVKDAFDRSNALTLNGSFTTGKGIADLYGMTGGVSFPTLPAVAPATTGTAFAADIDPGTAVYDSAGVLHTIPWQTFMAGFQYYLPPTGRLFVSANYTQGQSKGTDNIVDVVGGATDATGAANPRAKTVFKKSQYFDANLFFDVTRAVRTVVAYEQIKQTFGDNATATNKRFLFCLYYQF
jgi:hypothetical protein